MKKKRLGIHIPITSGLDNSILREVSKPVKKVDEALVELIADMHVTMKKEQGIGIAAPQVGVNLRLALAKLNPSAKKPNIIVMINPEITKRSMREQTDQEGCLSLREMWGSVARSESLTVTYRDADWEEMTLDLHGLNARIIQHEVDHLDGILFWDRVKEKPEAEKL
ncbi:MAG: peptide deformylase [Patescibacteria group bacterium]